MKQENYNELLSRYEAYQAARDMHWKEPQNLDYRTAVSWTFDNLMTQLRFTLWDEAPWGQKPWMNPFDDLPF